jgi:tetratricopeptide (TPR) repeat protein
VYEGNHGGCGFRRIVKGLERDTGLEASQEMDAPPHCERSSSGYGPYLFLFLLALAARLVFLIFISEPLLFIKYPSFAEKLALGEDIGERLVDLSPFYLYLLTFLKKAFAIDWTAVRFFQSFIGALNCLLVYTVGRRLFRKDTGFLAASMYAVYGNLIILESTLEPEVFVVSFTLLTVYFLSLSEHGDGSYRPWRLAAVAGLFAGLCVITKPNSLLFFPLAGLWLFFRADRDLGLKKRAVPVCVFVGSALLVILPITIRNYVKLNDVVLVTADAGKVFFHGNGEGATALEGTGLPDEGFAEEGFAEPDYAHVLFRRTAEKLTGGKITPSQSSAFWARRALGHIVDDPLAYLVLEAKKLFYFFNNYEMHLIASAYNEYKASLAFPFLRFGVISSLGLLGMLLCAKGFKKYFLAYAVVLVYVVSGMLFLVTARYRMPAVPYLCLFGGQAMVVLKETFAARMYRRLTGLLALLGVLFFLTTLYSPGDEISGVDRWQQATKRYYQRDARSFFATGRYPEAVEALDKCLAMFPGFAPALNLRGRAYAVLGQYDKAAKDFESVIALSPRLPHGYENLGFLYLLRGETSMARSHLLKALALDSQSEKVKKVLAELK